MKRLLIALLTITIMCFTFVGCGQGNTNKTESNQSESTIEETKDTDTNIGDVEDYSSSEDQISIEDSSPTIEESGSSENPLSFYIMDGETGEYGSEVILNAGTEFEEHEIEYHIPVGVYSITNHDQKTVQISVYSGSPEYDGEWQSFVSDESCARPIVIMPDETKSLEVKEGQFVILSDESTSIEFVLVP